MVWKSNLIYKMFKTHATRQNVLRNEYICGKAMQPALIPQVKAVEKAQKRSKMSLEKSVLLHPAFSTYTRSASLRFLTSNSLHLCIAYPGEAELTSAEARDIT